VRPVYVTRALPEPVLAELRRAFEVEVNPENRPLTPPELRAAAAGREALVCLLTDRIDEALLAAAGPQLRIVANVAVGFNNMDVAAAARRGVILTNTPGVLDDATATLAMALLLAAARRLAEADAYIRAGKWRGWSPEFFMGLDVDGKTLGIAGAGRIGRNLARKARAFGMRILYCGRRRDPAFEAETGAELRDKAALLREADFLSLHLPLNAETRHWIGARELALMKPTAVLINTARGPVVDEAALVAALRDGTLAAAGLDVFEDEPALAPGLAELPNVVLSPHIGSATPATREAMARLAARNVIEVLSGRPPLSPVGPPAAG
jgi:lactate dehydrogenase-like 2-hydroxyacid dehydrogenase